VLGSDRFAKISEVEGIKLTPAMKKRASDARSKGLTAEEYRRAIIRSHSKGGRRSPPFFASGLRPA
jgi:hypothetical protein